MDNQGNNMGQMSLKAGDKIIAYFYPHEGKRWHEYVTIKGFTCYGVHFEERDWLHWHTERNWYGCGYHNNGGVIYVKYAWLISRACIFDKVRLGKYEEIHFTMKSRPVNRMATTRRFERMLWPIDGGYTSRRTARDGGL